MHRRKVGRDLLLAQGDERLASVYAGHCMVTNATRWARKEKEFNRMGGGRW